MAEKRKFKRGKKSAKEHRPLGGMAGNAWSRLRERDRSVDAAIEDAVSGRVNRMRDNQSTDSNN